MTEVSSMSSEIELRESYARLERLFAETQKKLAMMEAQNYDLVNALMARCQIADQFMQSFFAEQRGYKEARDEIAKLKATQARVEEKLQAFRSPIIKEGCEAQIVEKLEYPG